MFSILISILPRNKITIYQHIWGKYWPAQWFWLIVIVTTTSHCPVVSARREFAFLHWKNDKIWEEKLLKSKTVWLILDRLAEYNLKHHTLQTHSVVMVKKKFKKKVSRYINSPQLITTWPTSSVKVHFHRYNRHIRPAYSPEIKQHTVLKSFALWNNHVLAVWIRQRGCEWKTRLWWEA